MSSVMEEKNTTGSGSQGLPPPAARVKVPLYGNEQPLFIISMVISVLFWLGLILGTFGVALLWVLAGFIAYLFAQSAFISYLKGTAVEITASQFPDLHERIGACCVKVGMAKPPRAYLLNGQGLLNAFATRFLGRNFLVLFSDVVDALKPHPQSLDFYIGHELGHLHRKHLIWGPVLMPSSIMPLLGAGYSRAREYTCDAYGQACCERPTDAALGLAVLAAGPQKWATVDVRQYAAQARESGGFWMSFHELTGDYPWLVKRMERLKARATNTPAELPRRHLGAWLLALFVPRVGAGGAAGLLVVIAIIGILAAVAIPAYSEFNAKAQSAQIFSETNQIRDKVGDYIIEHQSFPASLAEAGVEGLQGSDHIESVTLDGEVIVFELTGAPGIEGMTVIYEPSMVDGQLYWDCTGGELPSKYRPSECR